MKNRLKALVGKIKQDANELYTVTMLSFGVPGIAYIYLGWKAAVATFIVIQVALGVLRERA